MNQRAIKFVQDVNEDTPAEEILGFAAEVFAEDDVLSAAVVTAASRKVHVEKLARFARASRNDPRYAPFLDYERAITLCEDAGLDGIADDIRLGLKTTKWSWAS